MSNEELVKLIQDGEMERIEELYNQTYPLIYKVCSRFFGLEDTQDLLQEGYIALYKAALVYDPSRGASFSTVLYMVVRQSLKRYLSECGSTIKIPEYKRTLVFRYQQIVQDYEQRLARRPTTAEIAAILELSEEQVGDIEKAIETANTVSGENVVVDDLTIMDTVPDPEDPFEPVLDALQLEQLRAELWPAIDEILSEREARILSMRYVSGHTLQQCGEQLGIATGRVGEIERKSIRKLRKSTEFCQRIRPFYDSIAYSIGIRHTDFKRTHESSTERAAFKLMGI